MSTEVAIKQLHDHCGVYTSESAANRLLDEIGWIETTDLSTERLLEPCVGEGAILTLAIERLIASFRRYEIPLQMRLLKNRIVSFELFGPAHAMAIMNVEDCLRRNGLRKDVALKLAQAWIQKRDFLLEPSGQASHVAANPPYLRWSKVPSVLRRQYSVVLDPVVATGDLSISFLDRIFDWLDPLEGNACVLTNDRWLYAQYGDAFRVRIKDRGWTTIIVNERADGAFQRQVGVHAAIVSFRKGDVGTQRTKLSGSREYFAGRHKKLTRKFGSIADAGCNIRVGPALGAGRTFMALIDETPQIEPELIRPFVSRSSLSTGQVSASNEVLISPYDLSGKLVDLNHWPLFAKWAMQNSDELKKRSVVQSDERNWWRTIDAIGLTWQAQNKILIPELTQEFRCCLDQTKSVPAHSIYAIFSNEWPNDVLVRVLNDGLLELTAKALAPSMNYGWYRLYKRFLVQTPLPRWMALSAKQRAGLSSSCDRFYETVYRDLFEMVPNSGLMQR